MTRGQPFASLLQTAAFGGAMLVVGVGVAVGFGWLLDLPVVKSVVPGWATMKANTAIAFVAAGVALLLLRSSATGPRSLGVARCLAAFVLALGALSLIEALFNLDFGIDQIIFRDDPKPIATPHPGRMSPATGLSFIFIGLALLSLKSRRPAWATWAHWLVAPPIFVAALAIFGYSYGVASLYHISAYSSMAMHTALTFFVLALSIICADSEHGFARIAGSDSDGGQMSRRLLPTLPVILYVLSLLCLLGEREGYYSFEFGLALMVGMAIAVCMVAVAGTAAVLHQVDLTRKLGAAEIQILNRELEQRVAERTRELEIASEELIVANAELEQLSLHDGLTKLANRRHFDEYLASQIALARRNKQVLALILCDVDSFKTYNDHYGHQAGDACLTRIAAALQSCCRRPADKAARYGGEEFALVLPDTDLAGANRIAQAVRAAVATLQIPHAFSLVGPFVCVSGGVAVLQFNERASSAELIEAADRALYEAKRQGRDRMISTRAVAA